MDFCARTISLLVFLHSLAPSSGCVNSFSNCTFDNDDFGRWRVYNWTTSAIDNKQHAVLTPGAPSGRLFSTLLCPNSFHRHCIQVRYFKQNANSTFDALVVFYSFIGKYIRYKDVIVDRKDDKTYYDVKLCMQSESSFFFAIEAERAEADNDSTIAIEYICYGCEFESTTAPTTLISSTTAATEPSDAARSSNSASSEPVNATVVILVVLIVVLFCCLISVAVCFLKKKQLLFWKRERTENTPVDLPDMAAKMEKTDRDRQSLPEPRQQQVVKSKETRVETSSETDGDYLDLQHHPDDDNLDLQHHPDDDNDYTTIGDYDDHESAFRKTMKGKSKRVPEARVAQGLAETRVARLPGDEYGVESPSSAGRIFLQQERVFPAVLLFDEDGYECPARLSETQQDA
ncbi:uncharacterized protein [Littorina saxatilis]|uniref:uncharacterized protein n=1 Tax=Littorina saxatilis TaxID=31220 RepID=UPI0038B63E5F